MPPKKGSTVKAGKRTKPRHGAIEVPRAKRGHAKGAEGREHAAKARNEAEYVARRAAEDAAQAPIVRELVATWWREAGGR
jgi:hypothetical protein